MNTYYIRTVAADYQQLVALGKMLGAIVETEGVISAPGGCWDYIGPIHTPTGEVTQTESGPVPVMTPLVDAQGHAYIHINVTTPVDLKQAATALAVAHPEIGAALSNLGKYFLLDAQGNARVPDQPHRVFAS